jgi:phage FluMu protein Com
MRCTQCGMPLSPTNTSMRCPRCHTVNGMTPKTTVPLSSQQCTDRAWSRLGGVQHYGQVANSWKVEASPQIPFPSVPLFSSETADGQQNRVSLSPMAQLPFPQAGQMWQPNNPQAAVPVATPSSPPAPMGANMRSSGLQYAMSNSITASMYSAPAPAGRPRPPRVSNVGFIVGGLCVIVGAVILIFVYVMAQTLLVTSTSTAPTSSLLTTTHMPSPPVTIHTPIVVTSPTVGTFPGQQYIGNPQTASAVNTNTAQPLQVTTIFQPNQRIYVTFDIHPNGNNGAVCLVWYLNNRIVTQFPFAVTASARAGYSYAVYGVSGTGYVEIYWASSIACSDKLLAQHVNFTILK